MIRVNGALDAYKRLAVSPNSEIDDGFNDGIRQPVGMSWRYVFCNMRLHFLTPRFV
jgi:hypothetical protein